MKIEIIKQKDKSEIKYPILMEGGVVGGIEIILIWAESDNFFHGINLSRNSPSQVFDKNYLSIFNGKITLEND